MPFTTAQATNFFTSNVQMGLSTDQRNALAKEDLATIDNFQDFQKEELIISFKNCRNLDPAVPLSARSATRLLAALIAWHYYVHTGHAVTSQNMHFNSVLRNFYIMEGEIIDG